MSGFSCWASNFWNSLVQWVRVQATHQASKIMLELLPLSMCLTSKFFVPLQLGQGFNLLTLDYFQCSNCLVTLSPCFSAPDLSPVQVPLIQTPLGQSDSGESDTDSSSSVSTPTATTGETTKEETTAERRPVHGMYYRCRVPWLRAEPPPFVSFLIKMEKRRFCLNCVRPEFLL